MRRKSIFALLLAGAACLLLAGCQTKDEVIPQEDTFRSLRKLIASDAADNDFFGLCGAISGDIAVVGAPGVDAAGPNAGAAYVYDRNQGGTDAWGQVAKLVASNADDYDLFGDSVDISGDIIVVGASDEDGTGIDKGSAYIFYRNEGGANAWGQVKRLVASDAQDGDGFGFAVTIDGDTVVVGSNGADGAGTDRGAAYVFYRDQGGDDAWGQVAKLTAEDPADSDQFGWALDLAGDTLIIGSPGDNGAGTARGSAYLFSRDLGGTDAWGQLKKITAGDPSDGSAFGTTAALDGALAVVGAASEDGAGTNRGAAYLFGRDQGGAANWGQIKKLAASDAHNGDLFGYDVAVDGDYVVVGAAWSSGGGTQRGQAYVFGRSEGGTDNWGQAQILRASDGANEDLFGFFVAIDGLYVLGGSLAEDGAGTDRGAVYVFRKI